MPTIPITDGAFFDAKFATRPMTPYDPSLGDSLYLSNATELATGPRSVAILGECMQLQMKKSKDYQNSASTVAQADYYPTGIKTIHEIVHAKMLRMKSLIETHEANPGIAPNFESIADSAKDAINYLSFLAAYCEHAVPGQNPDHDILNRKFIQKLLP
jgi:hypothetical protein